jgi:hypothetical protein
MSVELYYAIILNGVEIHKRRSLEEASTKADRLRKEHGKYAVWIRPHYLLLAA